MMSDVNGEYMVVDYMICKVVDNEVYYFIFFLWDIFRVVYLFYILLYIDCIFDFIKSMMR